jgi:hypothetical protein
MSKFVFETGNRTWEVQAKNWKDAIKLAWGKNPPEELGLITSVTKNGGEEKYITSKTLLTEAGYDASQFLYS